MADKSTLVTLEKQVQRLMDEHARLDALCRELSAERETLKGANRSLEERLREVEGELARKQLTEGLAGGERDREKARARVNRLMREVDKCIALINKSEEVEAENQANEE